MDRSDICTLTVIQLKDKLTELNLNTSGKKVVLQNRLLKHFNLDKIAEETDGIEDGENAEGDEVFVEANNFSHFSTFTLRDIQESLNYFDGINHPEIETWISEFEDNALSVNWNELQKFIYAKQLIKGAAAAFVKSQSINSWRKLKETLLEEFGQSLSSIETHKLLQNRRKKTDESFLEYLYSIISLCRPAKIDEQSIIEYFIEGINDQKHRKSILYEATTIAELKAKIKIYEKIRIQTNFSTGNNNSNFTRNPKKCIHCPHLKNHSTMECKKSNSICFKCNKKGHKAHECRSNTQGNNDNTKQNQNNYNFKSNQGTNTRQNQNNYNFRQNQNNNNFRPHQNNNTNDDHSYQNNRQPTEHIHAIIVRTAIRIFKDVRIGDTKFKALVDTGCDMCLMPQSIFESIKNVELIEQSAAVRGLGQGIFNTLGYIETKAHIDNIKIKCIFHITEDVDADNKAILGSDILNVINMHVTSEGTTFTLKENVNEINKGKNQNEAEIIHLHEEYNDNGFENKDNYNPDFEAGIVFSAMCHQEQHDGYKDEDNFSDLPPSVKTELSNLVHNYQPSKENNCPIEMEITLMDDKPVWQHPRRISYSDQKLVEQQINDWLEAGIVRISKSKYASPIVLVKKKDGTKRLCCDYRQINSKIIRDNFPMNLVDDVIHKLADANIYTTLDLRNGFFHVPIRPDSQKYTAFVTHNGHYEFMYVPFGISNAPAVFCRFISAIFHDLIQAGIIVVYMDDIVIPSQSINENMQKLKQVIKISEKYGLQINWNKCQFLKTKINFLGYIIENASIKPSEEKTKVVKNFPVPRDTKSLQRFLGLTSYFRRFIEQYSTIAKSLTDLLCKDKKFTFEESHILAFNRLKSALINAPVLKLFKQGASTEIHTDASKYGYGGCLLQKNSETGQLHPVEYMSRKTNMAEENYHSYELEVLAVIQALKKWRIFLMDIPFKIVTDCKAFTMTLNKKEVPVRVSRWIMFLQDFDYIIEHRSGSKMRHVDALSRIYALLAQSPLKEKIIKAQNLDPWTKVIKEILEKEQHKDYFIKYDILHKDPEKHQIVIPELLEKEIIESAHKQGHFSAKKTEEIVNKEFYIPNLQEKAKNIVKSCIPCILAESKAGKKEGLLNPIDKSDTPLQTLHIDHVGPLEATKKQYNYVLTVVDSFSKFTWLFPTKSTGSNEVIDRLEKLTAVFGNPLRIISDRGTAFTSNDFKNFCNENNISHHLITTGVPRANGQVERSNRIVLALLTKLTLDNKQNWYKNIHKVQQFINNTPTRSTHVSPFKILTGMEMNIKEDKKLKDMLMEEQISLINNSRTEIRQMARDNIQKIQRENIKTFNKNRIEERQYEIGDLVAIKRTQFGTGLKLKGNFLGPYKVMKKKRLGRYLVEKVGEGEGPLRTSTMAEYMKPWNVGPRTDP